MVGALTPHLDMSCDVVKYLFRVLIESPGFGDCDETRSCPVDDAR